MLDLIGPIEFWHWLALALAFVALEAIVPGVAFLWLGVAAAAVGLIMMIAPDTSLTVQVVAFGVFAILAVYAGRRFAGRLAYSGKSTGLNDRGARLVGEVFSLDGPTRNGRGRLRVGDSTWSIRCRSAADLGAGAKVRVAKVDGTVLVVEPVV